MGICGFNGKIKSFHLPALPNTVSRLLVSALYFGYFQPNIILYYIVIILKVNALFEPSGSFTIKRILNDEVSHFLNLKKIP